MVNIWFTSDTHFGHERIIELCNRPFESVEHMNESIIENHNALVKPGDKVFHLGDLAMGKIAETLPLAARLNGDKALIPGNHDRVFSQNKQKMLDRFMPLYSEIFTVMPEQTKVPKHNLKMCHFPYYGDSHEEDRYSGMRPADNGDWLIHGHVHDSWKVNGRQINVGVDVWDFRPVHLDEILAITEAGYAL
jgi:calcineurin-like phosphoesterase family protein